MSITIRKKPISGGRCSLFLDIVEDKQRHKEYIKRFMYDKPKNQLEKIHNDETWQFATILRNRREQELFSDEVKDIIDRKKLKIKNQNFLEYVSNYVSTYQKKDKRMMIALEKILQEYNGKKILLSSKMNEQFCVSFKSYLTNRYNGETPQSYFARFKKILKQAYKDKVISTYPEVMNDKVKDHVKKEVLTLEEIQTLAKTKCGNEEVKKAFLFACYTGIRFCDIKMLKWKNVQKNIINIKQEKTGFNLTITLNKTAITIIGERKGKNEHVFDLPTHTATSKNIKLWVRSAEIDKHITFHCARHTYGTNLAFYGNDTLMIANLLGQTTMKYVPRYVRLATSMKENASNSIPDLNFDI